MEFQLAVKTIYRIVIINGLSPVSFMKSPLTPDQISHIIRMAWEDRTTFDEIKQRTGCREAEVIELMRRELKPSSFRMWRKRVSGRITKHRRRLEALLHGPSQDSDED